MNQFDIYSPGTWFDDSRVLMMKTTGAKRRDRSAPIAVVRDIMAGLLMAASIAPGIVSSAYSSKPVIHSTVSTGVLGEDKLPVGYWKSIIKALQRTPTYQESMIEGDVADPVL